MLFSAQKWFIGRFLEISIMFDFCDDINFEKSKKSPWKHQKGGNLEDSYSHENLI